MLVISFKLIWVFFGLHISAASAIPAAAVPAALVPRVIPADEPCVGLNALWLRRECFPDYRATEWRDVCVTYNFGEGGRGGATFYRYHDCPPDTVCENTVDQDQNRSIQCVNKEKPGTSVTRTAANDPQIGTSYVMEAHAGLDASEFAFSVTVEDDMIASVAAVILSDDQTFASTKYCCWQDSQQRNHSLPRRPVGCIKGH